MLVLAGVGASATVRAPAASAAPGCQGAGCTGQWPRAMDCVTGAVEIAWLDVTNTIDPTILQGAGKVVYSPRCRAVFGEFVMAHIAYPDQFLPQLWAQPQYGGFKVLASNVTGFQAVDGVLDGSPNEVVQSRLHDWSESVRLCLHDNTSDVAYDKDYVDPVHQSGPSVSCTEWQ